MLWAYSGLSYTRSCSIPLTSFGTSAHSSRENDNDIAAYIQESSVPSTVQMEISKKSGGSFQWVVLVLNQVLDLYNRGKSKAVLLRYVHAVPLELTKLYQRLIEEIDKETLPESLQLIQWICVAIRPLSLTELRFAMIVDVDTPFQTIRECQETEKFAETDEEMKRRIRDLSKGLAEIKTHQGKPIAQFIHQSVNDYVATHW